MLGDGPTIRARENEVILKRKKKAPPWEKVQRWKLDVWLVHSHLTAFRRLCKMGRTDSILIGLRRAISCWNEDEEIYNFAVEGFSRFDLEIGRKCTSLQAVTVLTGFY